MVCGAWLSSRAVVTTDADGGEVDQSVHWSTAVVVVADGRSQCVTRALCTSTCPAHVCREHTKEAVDGGPHCGPAHGPAHAIGGCGGALARGGRLGRRRRAHPRRGHAGRRAAGQVHAVCARPAAGALRAAAHALRSPARAGACATVSGSAAGLCTWCGAPLEPQQSSRRR